LVAVVARAAHSNVTALVHDRTSFVRGFLLLNVCVGTAGTLGCAVSMACHCCSYERVPVSGSSTAKAQQRYQFDVSTMKGLQHSINAILHVPAGVILQFLGPP
jgi:hypothetical protein